MNIVNIIKKIPLAQCDSRIYKYITAKLSKADIVALYHPRVKKLVES